MNSKLIFFIFFYLLSCVSSNASTTLKDSFENTLFYNSDLKLEKSRLQSVKATKGDAFVEFLPDIRAVYQKGRQKNNAVGQDRGDLDKMSDQDMKRITLNQPVFSGFTAINKSKEINYNIKSATQYYHSKKDEILLETVQNYMYLYKNRKILEIKQENKKNNNRLYRLIKQRNRLGQVGGSEVITYEARYSTAKSEVLAAKKELFRSEQEYIKSVGKIDFDLQLPIVNESNIPENEQDISDLVVANNSLLKQYHYQIKSSKSSLNQARGEFLPKAEISAQMEEQENVVWLSNGDMKSRSLYLNVSVPIFQKGSEYSSLSKAKKQLHFSKKEYELNKQNLIKEAKQSYREYSFYKDLLVSDNDLIGLTKERLDKISKQVDLGQGDIIDFINVKIEYNKILEQQFNNQAEYVISYYKLLMLMGKILTYKWQ